MFGFLGRLFGSDKASEKIIDSVSNGIDKMWHTDEEKAEAAAAARTEGFQVYMKWLESTSGSRVARRVIAFLVTGVWVLEHLISVALGAVAIFVAENIDKYKDAADMFAEHANNNNALVGVVLLFYFGGPVAIDGVKGLVTKWTDKK